MKQQNTSSSCAKSGDLTKKSKEQQMNLIGQPVEHKAFGSGIIMDLTDGVVTIHFQDNPKKFIYPDAFQDFLTLKQQDAQQRVESMIRARELSLKKARAAAQKKQEDLQRLSNFKIIANSHVIFHIAPEQVSRIAETWQVSTGTYMSGYSRGLPRTAARIKPNSACLLTTCSGSNEEQERSIIGFFMVEEDFFGEDAHNGLIKVHRQHRIFLPEEQWVPFWKYFSSTTPSRWGNTSFKYCSVKVMDAILYDMAETVDASGQSEATADFYRYFRKLNRLPTPITPKEQQGDKKL